MSFAPAPSKSHTGARPTASAPARPPGTPGVTAPLFSPRQPLLQRRCACGGTSDTGGECAECRRKKSLLRHASGPTASEAPPLVREVLATPGRPLDAATRAFFEPRFQHDFSRVRLHDDARAMDSASAVSALAYTVGQHVVWGDAARTPESDAGRALLAHELEHTRQQQGFDAVPSSLEVHDDPALESAAEQASQQFGSPAACETTAPASLQRQSLQGAEETARRAWRRGERAADRASEWFGRQSDRVERLADRAGDWASEQVTTADEEASRWWNSGTGAVTAMRFNGSALEVVGTPSLTVRALSGLLPNHPSAHGVDMTQPAFQHLEGQGPIPEGHYYVDPHEVEHNPPGSFNTAAWGRHRVRIHETTATALNRRWIGRTGGFFLHQDANSNGTAGCIGIVSAADNARVTGLVEANTARIPIEVTYPSAAPATSAAAPGSTADPAPGPGRVARARRNAPVLNRRAARGASPGTPRRAFLASDEARKATAAGSPLETASRSYFERWLGQSLDDVRIHTDAAAARDAARVQAAAFTLGRDLFFGSGQYAPQSLRGRWVLAHELVHVAQQGTSSARSGADRRAPTSVSSPSDAHEREASAFASLALGGIPLNGRAFSPARADVIHPVHPGLIAGGVVAAIAACAYSFYRHALANYSGRQGYNDKFMHCYTSCKIASWCGGGPIGPSLVAGLVISEVLGILKEVADYIKNELGIGTPADASWEDWIADQYGLLCALDTFGSCHECCRSAPGAVSPGSPTSGGGTP